MFKTAQKANKGHVGVFEGISSILIYYIQKVDMCSPLRSLDLTLIRLEIIKFQSV